MERPPNSWYAVVDVVAGVVVERQVFHDPGFINSQGQFCWPGYGGEPLGPAPMPKEKR